MLLVDDDELLRAQVAEVLLEIGLKVTEAPDAEHALAMTANEDPPTLVVTDVNLGPGMNGFELVIAARHRWPAVPVLMISGLASNFVGRQPGIADRFLRKPFPCSSLLHEVRALSGQVGE